MATTTRLILDYLAGTEPLGDISTRLEDLVTRLEGLIPGPICAGETSCSVPAANTDYSQYVSFPSWFTDMVDDLGTGAGIAITFGAELANLNNPPVFAYDAADSSGFTMRWRRPSASSFTASYFAVVRIV